MRARFDSGFTILEVMIAIAVITLGLLALLAVFPGVISLSRQSRETQIAYSAARSHLDLLRSMEFPNAGNTNTNMFKDGPVTFTAVGLDAPAAGQPHGRVFWMTEMDTARHYRLNLDLNLNGTINETATATPDFLAFPVRAEVRWRDETANVRTVTLTTIIYNHNQ